MTIRELHEQAMALMDAALLHRQREEHDEALSLFRQAFETEKQAAADAVRQQVIEPTRSVLLRSAACLALDCSRWREAEKLVALGLSGEPPEPIAEELRDLMKEIIEKRAINVKILA